MINKDQAWVTIGCFQTVGVLQFSKRTIEESSLEKFNFLRFLVFQTPVDARFISQEKNLDPQKNPDTNFKIEVNHQ
jgi:hypothetical protein